MENVVRFGDFYGQFGVRFFRLHGFFHDFALFDQALQRVFCFGGIVAGRYRGGFPRFGPRVQFLRFHAQGLKVAFFRRVEGGAHNLMKIRHFLPSPRRMLSKQVLRGKGEKRKEEQAEKMFHIELDLAGHKRDALKAPE